jgi:hypothetical protein
MHGILWPAHPAYIACEQGNWNALRNLLGSKRASVRDRSGLGDTFLHERSSLSCESNILIYFQIAARCNHVGILVALLAEGSAVDAENDFGE